MLESLDVFWSVSLTRRATQHHNLSKKKGSKKKRTRRERRDEKNEEREKKCGCDAGREEVETRKIQG